MGGGAGTRLFPLTKERAKPAVPLGGKYRLVDIPISNCINSGLRRMFVLTQFNSTSLHRHIHQTYRFDAFAGGFVEILAAQQRPGSDAWYQGTADAVRQNLQHFAHWRARQILILSGDQLYRMDFRELLDLHREKNADITVAVHPVGREVVSGLGLVGVDESGRIRTFLEKPEDDERIREIRADRKMLDAAGAPPGHDWLASMGIYVFETDVLADVLNNTLTDFGRDIIPRAIQRYRVFAYPFVGYWEDIGTIRCFYEANLDLTAPQPRFDLYNEEFPIFSRPRSLPATKLNRAAVDHCILADGCMIEGADLRRSVVGIRSVIGRDTVIRDSIIMGNDYYRDPDLADEFEEPDDLPPLGIGCGCRIERAIIDKNVRIGDGAVITPDGLPDPYDGRSCHVRDGIVIVPKNAVLPPGRKVE